MVARIVAIGATVAESAPVMAKGRMPSSAATMAVTALVVSAMSMPVGRCMVRSPANIRAA